MKIRNATARLIAIALAFVLVLSLAAVPAKAASAELKFGMEGMEIDGKLVVTDSMLALLAQMGAEGEVYLDGAAYVGAAGLAIASNTLLDQAYGIDLANLLPNLKNSVFAPDSGSSLAMDEETYNTIISALEGGASAVTNPVPQINVDSEILEQIAAVGIKYTGIAAQSVMANAQLDTAQDTVSVGANDYNATILSVAFNSEGMAAIAESVLSAAASDEDLKQAVSGIADIALEAAAAQAAAQGTQLPAGADLVEEIWAQLPALAEQAPAAIAQSNMTLAASIGVDSDSGMPLFVSLLMEADGESVTIAITTVPDYVSVAVYQGEAEVASIRFVTFENSDAAYTAQFAVSESGNDTASVDFTWDKTTGVYQMGLTTEGETVLVSGTLTVTDDTVTCTVDMVDGTPVELAVILSSADTDVTMPEFKEILTMTEEEVMNCVQMLSSIVEAFAQ